MNKVILFLMMASASVASPFMDHPNVLAALPAPFNGEYYTLELTQLQAQNPQYGIFYTGGLIGYFVNESRLPVWTTPQVVSPVDFPWVFQNNDEVRNDVNGPVFPESNRPKHDDPFCVPSNPVPEPSSAGILLIGAALILLGVRNRSRF